VLIALRADGGRPRGDSWALAVAQRDAIERFLDRGVRLSKIRRLLVRQGVAIPYPTLHRFAVAELDFGRTAATVPVADGEPGHEVQLDTGWMTLLGPDARGKQHRMRAWIFTPGVSRLRFVYPCFPETTATAIEACEAAWAFYGGIFRVILPDNTKAIVQHADPLEPTINPVFLEYAQARGFHIDPTRVRHPKDKARVERAVASVRDDCFGVEDLRDLDHAREHARQWCLHEYGTRRHGRTQRMPLEHFEAEEKGPCCPRPPRRTTSRCGVTPRSIAITSLRWRRRSTPCRRAGSARPSGPEPTATSSASTTARSWRRPIRASPRREVSRSVRPPGPQDALRPA